MYFGTIMWGLRRNGSMFYTTQAVATRGCSGPASQTCLHLPRWAIVRVLDLRAGRDQYSRAVWYGSIIPLSLAIGGQRVSVKQTFEVFDEWPRVWW